MTIKIFSQKICYLPIHQQNFMYKNMLVSVVAY
uniref:Uncharacterized protein n=1 Tax=Podoviridae sp. ctwV53 TaxID=2826587 RepID=A0A8S5MT68_9CAUD|nr:MAG TPA: hypothetical protein [Podoviridae sp. ctwV53]